MAVQTAYELLCEAIGNGGAKDFFLIRINITIWELTQQKGKHDRGKQREAESLSIWETREAAASGTPIWEHLERPVEGTDQAGDSLVLRKQSITQYAWQPRVRSDGEQRLVQGGWPPVPAPANCPEPTTHLNTPRTHAHTHPYTHPEHTPRTRPRPRTRPHPVHTHPVHNRAADARRWKTTAST